MARWNPLTLCELVRVGGLQFGSLAMIGKAAQVAGNANFTGTSGARDMSCV